MTDSRNHDPAESAPAEKEPDNSGAASTQAGAATADIQEEVVHLPAPTAMATADEPRADDLLPLFRQFDFLFAGLVVMLAIFLASYPARNSDLWLHLGTAKALVNGTYTFGVHPFTYTDDGSYWVNHSWLFDLLAYGIYSVAGGGALVALKALLVGWLTLLMIRLARLDMPREYFLWIPAFCALAAVLAMSPWLPLRSVVVSYVLLALTLLFLVQGTKKLNALTVPDGTPPARAALNLAWRAYWPLFLVFVAWVNMDGLFLLGPLTVLLFLVGQALGRRGRPAPAPATGLAALSVAEPQRQTVVLAVTLGLGLAVCLLSPHHVHAFRLPPVPGFSHVANLMQQDPSWRGQGLSPLNAGYLWLGARLNPAALAYYFLLGLGLWAFLHNLAARSWWQVTLWTGFAALSLYQSHLIPFFAVVAAPLTAANLTAANLRLYGLQPDLRGATRALAVAARPLAFFAGLALLVMAWPGWLQPSQPGGDEPRAWEAPIDPSLQEAAFQLARWRNELQVTTNLRGLNSSLDVANYLAWFCPEEKSFLNASLHGSSTVVNDYLALRRDLITRAVDPLSASVHKSGPPVAADRWKKLLKQYELDYLVLHVGQRPFANAAFMQLVTEGKHWSLVHLSGDVAIFAWKGEAPPQHQNAFAGLELNFDQLAFQPSDDLKAPLHKPVDAYPIPGWWEPFVRGDSGPALKRNQAGMYLFYFDAKGSEFAEDTLQVWRVTQACALTGQGAALAVPSTWPVGLGPLAWNLDTATFAPTPTAVHQYNLFRTTRNTGPVSVLFLAIRAARQAIAENPYDALAYLILGEAYGRLLGDTQENIWRNDVPQLEQMRQSQMLSAFKTAVRLKPDLVNAHHRLAQLYGPAGLKLPDLELEHLQAWLQLRSKAGPQAPQSRLEFEDKLLAVQQRIEFLEKGVREADEKLAKATASRTLSVQAEKAYEAGLADKALQLLIKADLNLIGKSGIALELDLLLKTGQAGKAEVWIEPVAKHLEVELGEQSYCTFRALLTASLGDYKHADGYLQKLFVGKTRLTALDPAVLEAKQAISFLGALAVLQELTPQVFPIPLTPEDYEAIAAPPVGATFRSAALFARMLPQFKSLQANANLLTLRAVLALEVGEVDQAKHLLEEALTIWSVPADAGCRPIDFPARRMAEAYLGVLAKHSKKS